MKFIEMVLLFLVKDDAENICFIILTFSSIHGSTAIVAYSTFGPSSWHLICRSPVLLMLYVLAYHSTYQRWNSDVTFRIRHFDTFREHVLSLNMLKHSHLLTLELFILHKADNIIIFFRLTKQDVELVGVE